MFSLFGNSISVKILQIHFIMALLFFKSTLFSPYPPTGYTLESKHYFPIVRGHDHFYRYKPTNITFSNSSCGHAMVSHVHLARVILQ